MSDKPAFVPSVYQARFFDWVSAGSGSAVLVAVAGSGKTTSVVNALPLIDERASVRLLAFNKSIADELNGRLNGLRNDLGRAFANFEASTFHSLGFRAVRKHIENLVKTRIDTRGDKSRTLIREFMSEPDLDMYGDFVCQLVSLAKGHGIGCLVPDVDQMWYELIQHHDLFLDSEDATEARAVELARQLMERSELAAKQRGLLDFDDQLYLVVRWKLRLWQNDWVVVDEAQDTNPIRRALIKLALKPGGRLVAVGDPRQAIYGFTGASHDAIEQIKRQFAAVELPLTVSYRCAKSIVRAAQSIVPYLEAFEDAPEGVVESLDLSTALTHLGAHDAILCRQTAPLIVAAYQLIAKGVGCTVLGREIGAGLVKLVHKMKARGIDALQGKLSAYLDREVAKYTAKGEEQKAEAVADRVACIYTMIDNLSETERTIPALVARMESMFSDTNGVLTLSTIHKAKGKEWGTVAILRPDLMPSKWARQDWQMLQEENLRYVAITRAKTHLITLTDQPPPKAKKEEN